jgi:single-stranded-DNA-specific exonuclease
MPEAIWRIVSRRGYHTKEDLENLFQPKLKDMAHPFSLDEMDQATDRLVKAFQNKEKILIYGDYDLDGTPGIALLTDGLRQLGYEHVIFYQPSRLKEGYGFHAHLIPQFKELGVSLIVTVDVGITDLLAAQAAKHAGIDLIVTDHHLPKEELPTAVAIVNPNKGTCSSHLQHLCGTGVAFYLLLALRIRLNEKKLLRDEFDPKSLLDLFALATITDMVPLVGENRSLVKHGLKSLSRTERPGLKELFVELGFYSKNLSAQDVSFRIAPKLNALTRLDEGLRALDVITADTTSARNLVQETLVINKRRGQFQDRAKKVAQEILKDKNFQNFIFIHSPEFHPGVISLLANDLMQQTGLPAFVGAELPDGRIIGSARARAHNLQDILGAGSEFLEKFGGHKMAAGFELELHNVEKLAEKFENHLSADGGVTSAAFVTDWTFDTEITLSELNPTFMGWYENLGPFGMGFAAPKLMLRRARVAEVKKLKGSFLRYNLATPEGEIEAPWFQNPQEFAKDALVDVLFEPQWNEFQGRKKIQALVQGMQLS